MSQSETFQGPSQYLRKRAFPNIPIDQAAAKLPADVVTMVCELPPHIMLHLDFNPTLCATYDVADVQDIQEQKEQKTRGMRRADRRSILRHNRSMTPPL